MVVENNEAGQQQVQTTDPSQQATEQQSANVQPKSDDLLKRVSTFMDTNDPSKTGVPVDDDFHFDINEIQKIENPEAREMAEKAYKSFQKGFNKKFQELADLRKKLEVSGDQRWTTDRIQQLINDPEFLQAAQSFAGTTNNPSGSGLTDEEWSALNDKERAQLMTMQSKINQLEQANHMALKSQQDAHLKQTYANYDATKVDSLLNDMRSGRVQATREHIWKVIDYERAIERAYSLGKQDGQQGNVDRVNASSIDGTIAQPNQTIQPDKDESSLNFFQRVAKQRLADFKAGKQQRT